jgi:predicted dinucleotide-binding enzyme
MTTAVIGTGGVGSAIARELASGGETGPAEARSLIGAA